MTSIAHRTLGRSNLSVSILGFGAEAIGRQGRSFEEADRTLNAVLDMGVTLIDTASAYGQSEAFIGRAISQRKKDWTLVTKCGWNSDWSPAWKPTELEQAIENSLRLMKLEALDVMLLHSCPLEDLKRGEATGVIQKAQSQGKARFIGYSGDNEALRYAVESGVFDVIECSFSILDQANAAAIAEAAKRNLGVVIKRPIANAVPGRSEKPRSEYAAQYWPRWQEYRGAIVDKAIPQSSDWLNTAIRYAGFWPGVRSVLVGSSHAEHMLENAKALAAGPLANVEQTDLTEAFLSVGRDWPGLG
jgi:aryl-alcohol dehydrogenase-like predicted oxidoreductase